MRQWFEKMRRSGALRTLGRGGCTALCILGALAVLGTAGAADLQDAAALPALSMAGFAGRMAIGVLLIAGGWAGRRLCLAPRRGREKRRAASRREAARTMEGRA